MPNKKLTEKQKRFCEEYLIDLNATRAYKVAYPKVKKDTVAQANGSRLLLNAMVKNYIDEQLKKLHNEKTADAQEVVEYLTSVMRGECTEQTLKFIGNGEQRITNIDVSSKDRLKAAELLGKRYGLFTDKVDINADMDLNITVDYGDNDESNS